ncbi:MAG TPA: potassium channel family protein, partial [Thermosynergistes sp.]|nr:potassium channel family protein [Thermosynergistes sp.]
MAKLKTATLWLAVLGGVLLTGAIGLRVTTDLSWYDALFYTVITLTTVGYEAPPDLTPEAKLFLIVFVVSGFGIAGIALTQLAQHFFVERISEALAMRRDRR